MKRHRGPPTRGILSRRYKSLVVVCPQVVMSNNPRARVRKLQKEASVLDKMKWAFSGKGKSEKLLQDLQWFVDTLHELVPIGLTLRHPRISSLEWGMLPIRRYYSSRHLRQQMWKLLFIQQYGIATNAS
jgi:hypothetical protein